jgi:hypothetical protein
MRSGDGIQSGVDDLLEVFLEEEPGSIPAERGWPKLLRCGNLDLLGRWWGSGTIGGG